MDFSPVPVRRHVVVWDVRPEVSRGRLFEITSDQSISPIKDFRIPRGSRLPSLLKLDKFRRPPPVISLHPAVSRTFILSFEFARGKDDPPVVPDALRSMAQDFLSRTNFEMRRLSAEELGVDEMDSVLLDARVERVLADGMETRDDRPVQGRRMKVFLRATFAPRPVFVDLHDLLHSGLEMFFTEQGLAPLEFLRNAGEKKFSFLDLETREGWLNELDYSKEDVFRKRKLRWAAGRLPAVFAEEWGVSGRASSDIYGMFLRGEMSSHAARFARHLLGPLEDSFASAVRKAKIDGPTWLREGVRLSFDSSASAGRGVSFEEIPVLQMMDRAGLSYRAPEGYSSADSIFLLPLIEYLSHRGDPHGHRVLARQIHWISS